MEADGAGEFGLAVVEGPEFGCVEFEGYSDVEDIESASAKRGRVNEAQMDGQLGGRGTCIQKSESR